MFIIMFVLDDPKKLDAVLEAWGTGRYNRCNDHRQYGFSKTQKNKINEFPCDLPFNRLSWKEKREI